MTTDQLSNPIEEDTSLDEVQIPPSTPLSEDIVRYRDLFKPRYRPRYVKNKGAILILVWNYAVWSVFSPINTTVVHDKSVLIGAILIICVGMVGSITGWLADVRFGRYRVITWSAWIMWISSILVTLSSVIAHLVEPYKNSDSKVSLAFSFIMGLGYCGFTINLLQFGVDQLHDASTSEITSFIAWFVGTLFSGQFSPHFVSACVQKYASLINSLLITFYLTVIVVTHSLLNHWLIKEPITQNPFKLVYNVLKYAIKNKHPRQRSAFTYCEDTIPSRIDFGKSKYGGSFTTEQVEDVKILFLTSIFILVNAIFFGTTCTDFTVILTPQIKAATLQQSLNDESLQTCFSQYMQFNGVYFLTAMIMIPINELFVYPIFHHCLPYYKSYNKFIAGAVIRIAKYVTLIALITSARHQKNTESLYHRNATIPCLFDEASSGSLNNALDGKWFILPQIFSSLSDMLILISVFEHFCAQVPYSMKGLVAGFAYTLWSLFIAVGMILSLPFSLTSSWSQGTISCGFWYLLTKLILLLIAGTLVVVAGYKYKQRQREDVLPNEHIFAERYYSK